MFKLTLQFKKYKVLALAGLTSLFQFSPVNANECLQMLPANTIKDGIPKVCQSDFSGTKLDYVCQDYRAGEQHYQVLYQGGVTPKAILRTNTDNRVTPMAINANACPLPAPTGIPSHALHRGIGLCLDQNDDTVPCSIYEHAEAREPVQYRHMVFYKHNKPEQNKVSIETQVIDANHDAMAAELAYQIGISLSQTECCADQAIEYLAYAHQLFPHANVYRKAYQLSLNNLASNEVN
jgi:hypothetical protein